MDKADRRSYIQKYNNYVIILSLVISLTPYKIEDTNSEALSEELEE